MVTAPVWSSGFGGIGAESSLSGRPSGWRSSATSSTLSIHFTGTISSLFLMLSGISTRPFKAEAPTRDFWLLVALPLLFFYMLRLPFPDPSFDVLNYRLLHAERSLRGTLLAPGDFFPTPAPYNPAPDTLTALFHHALGYRLGTAVNLLALVWSAQVLDKILRPFVARARLRAACVLLVMLAEHLLFEVNTYMVDLIALPLLLEATHLTLRAVEAATRGDAARDALTLDDARDGLTLDDARHPVALFAHVAFLLGAAAALKLTNAVVVPRTQPRREQLIRASLFSDLGIVDLLLQEDLTPESLAEAIERRARVSRTDIRDRVRTSVDLDGVVRTAAGLSALVRRRVAPLV